MVERIDYLKYNVRIDGKADDIHVMMEINEKFDHNKHLQAHLNKYEEHDIYLKSVHWM